MLVSCSCSGTARPTHSHLQQALVTFCCCTLLEQLAYQASAMSQTVWTRTIQVSNRVMRQDMDAGALHASVKQHAVHRPLPGQAMLTVTSGVRVTAHAAE